METTKEGHMRGQTFIIDLFMFLTSSLFVVMLFLFMVSTTNTFRMQDERMQKSIENAADILVSQGSPLNWESNLSNIHILGLADRKGKIDPSKLQALNQTEFTEFLSLNPYNVSIKLLKDGTAIYSTGWYNSSANVAVTERVVLYDGSAHLLRIIASEELK